MSFWLIDADTSKFDSILHFLNDKEIRSYSFYLSTKNDKKSLP